MDNLPAVFQGGQIAAKFQSLVAQTGTSNADLSEGVGAGFAVLSIKGSKWRIKHKGEEYPIIDQTTGDPVPSLEAVIVKANPHMTKQYYAAKYEDGSTAAPDCYSLDGKKPAAEAPSPQHTNCAACPMNAFGSRISDSGKKAKACSDTRRLVIVPLADMRNESFGGPMLLRVPPSALKGLAEFSSMLSKRGYPYYAVGVRIGFDMDASHPLPTFKPIRPLTEDEAEVVMELRESDITDRILADFSAAETPAAAPAGESDEVFEQPPKAAPPVAAKPAAPVARSVAPAAAPKPAVVPAVARPVAPVAAKPVVARPAAPAAAKPVAPKPVAPKPAAAPAPVPESTGDLDADIAGILAGLDAVVE